MHSSLVQHRSLAPAAAASRAPVPHIPCRWGCSSTAAAPRSTSVTTRAALDGLDVTTATYAALGLAGLSFVATFGLAPQFKTAFKEELDWKDIHTQLTQAGGVQQLDAVEAAALSDRGAAVLLDVRLASKYEAMHAAASVSGPLYLPIQEWSLPSIIRRAGFAFFGIYGTELNTSFADEVAGKVPKGKQVVLLCETGGSLLNKSGTKFGFQSRALKAAYFLQQAGYDKVAYVQGGLPSWVRQGLPTAQGPEDLEAVPALNMPEEPAEDDEGGSRPGSPFEGLKELIGGLKLPQLSFLQPRR